MQAEEGVVRSVSDVLRRLDQLRGQTVRVRGMLVVPAEGVYLVDLDAPAGTSIVPLWETADRLEVDHADLVDRLLADVPAFGGGPFMYRDDAVVVGTLTNQPPDAAALTDLHALTVTRDGIDYHVRLNAVD